MLCIICRVGCMSVTVCDWRSMVDQEFTCMVHTQSKNKEDIDVSLALQQDVNGFLRDMYDEVSSGRMEIPDLSNIASPHSNMFPP